MSAPAPALKPIRGTWNGWVLTAVFLALAILIFVAIYFAFPDNQHYTALLLIGVLCLLFALFSYLAEALSREPTSQRSLAWGFFGMGFSVLYLTVILGPYYVSGILNPFAQLLTIILLTIVLAIAVVGIVWRMRAVRATENQMVSRGSWQKEPAPSAFSYAAAKSPSVPQASPPPVSGPSNPPRNP
jgi:MFS family permease